MATQSLPLSLSLLEAKVLIVFISHFIKRRTCYLPVPKATLSRYRRISPDPFVKKKLPERLKSMEESSASGQTKQPRVCPFFFMFNPQGKQVYKEQTLQAQPRLLFLLFISSTSFSFLLLCFFFLQTRPACPARWCTHRLVLDVIAVVVHNLLPSSNKVLDKLVRVVR